MLGIANVKIQWGDIVISDWFNLESIDKVGSMSPFTYKQEMTVSGKACLIASANNENSFNITVTRNELLDTSVRNDLGHLRKLFKNLTNKILRVTKDDRTVLVEYKNAILTDDKFMLGEVSDGQKSTVKITWSVSNS